MPIAEEIIGPGTRFSGSSTGSFDRVRDIEGPNEEADDIDISSQFDASDAKEFRRRFRAGMVDPGEISITCVYTASGYAAARNAIRDEQSFTITTEDGSTLSTADDSYIKSVSPSYPWEEECVYDVVIKVSGQCTMVIGS